MGPWGFTHVALLFVIVGSLVASTLGSAPESPLSERSAAATSTDRRVYLPAIDTRARQVSLVPQALREHQPTPTPEPRTPALSRNVLAYYVPYDPTSWASLQEYASGVDYLGVQWVYVDACGNLGSRDDQTVKRFAQARGIKVFPSLLTSSGALNHRLLTEPATTERFLQQIVTYVVEEGYDGFDLDLEGVNAEDRPAFSAFVARLAEVLHAQGKPLAMAIPSKGREVMTGWAGAYDYAALGQHADLITIMTYDYRGAWSGPGPVAPYNWVNDVIAFATSQIPSHKVLLGLAFYGYDWNVTSDSVRSLRFPQAAELAQRYGVPLALDPSTRSATFRFSAPAGDPPPAGHGLPPLRHEFTDHVRPPCGPPPRPSTPAPTPTPKPGPPPDAIQQHEVWIEDSRSAAARLEIAERHRTGGVATWRLGQEDVAVWPIFREWKGLPR